MGALPAPSKRVIERIMIEHMSHAGTMNGELVVTYDDFEKFGVSRKCIKTGIDIARALGFIDVTFKGVRSYGSARRPSQYALTWLSHNDGNNPTNRWKAIKSKEQADEMVDVVRNKKQRRQAGGSDVVVDGCEHAPSQDK